MWFKNLGLLRFSKPFELTPDELESRLQAGRFRPCGSLEVATYGFKSPIGKEDAPLVYASNGCMMICAAKEEKLLPAAVVNERLAERIEEIEARSGRKPGKKERDSLRDDVIHELLPRAFSHVRQTYAYIDPKGGWLVVDSASARKTEELASYLRRCVETLPVSPPATQERPQSVMTRWLAEDSTPSDIVIESECELRSTDEEGGVVRCRRQDLSAPEIKNHLSVGKEVSRLALSWNDRLSFVLDENLGIRRLRFLDLVQEQAAEVETDDQLERFDVDFSIMTLELAAFLPRLLELFGGESDQLKKE